MRIHTLDLRFQGVPGIIAAYLVEGSESLTLVETGPGSTRENLLAAVRALGFDPGNIGHVFVTHIHLDHAGGAGWWARQGARVYCHPNAEKHLVDPSKLIESAQRIYGKEMDRLWGEILPAPADRVTALQDRERVRIGELEFIAWDTPGHARHHHAFMVGDACFTGDVAGVRLENSGYLSVAAAPPQFDPDAYVQSVRRIAGAKPERLFLTHFGEVSDVASHLENYCQRIAEVSEKVRSWHAAGRDEESLRKLFADSERAVAKDRGVSGALWEKYELANSTAMCADGVRLYWRKREEDKP